MPRSGRVSSRDSHQRAQRSHRLASASPAQGGSCLDRLPWRPDPRPRCAVRDEAKTLKKDYDKTEDDLKALQSVGQIIGEVLRQLDDERCAHHLQRPAPRAHRTRTRRAAAAAERL